MYILTQRLLSDRCFGLENCEEFRSDPYLKIRCFATLSFHLQPFCPPTSQ
jgi:hypothetical protein